jgi:hypothetical protein
MGNITIKTKIKLTLKYQLTLTIKVNNIKRINSDKLEISTFVIRDKSLKELGKRGTNRNKPNKSKNSKSTKTIS